MIKPEHINKFQDFWTPNDPEKDITLRKRLMVNEKASERKARLGNLELGTSELG